MKQTSFNPEALPDFFRDVEIVGPAHLELPKYRAIHAEWADLTSSQHGEVSADSSPKLMMTKTVKETYKSNDFAKIKQMEAAAQNDLQAVYTNISTNAAKAWTKVRKDGKEFYMSWSDTGSVWAYTESMSTVDGADRIDDVKYEAVVQIGTYSKSSEVIGIQSYNLTFTTMLVESAIAFIVARAVSSIIADGLGFIVARFAIYLAQAAAEIGFESFAFSIPVAALSSVATGLVFAIVFIGLVYLWNWLNRKYTIRLQIFNWDGNNSWITTGQTLSNAKIPGNNQDLNFILPKMVSPGDVVVPPGFQPVEVLDSVCYYAVIIWENDNTFMEGCSMAIGMQKDKTNEGFMWAFDCPRWSDNKQGGNNGLQDPKTYLQNVQWNKSPMKFQIESTSEKIPVSFALDALNGASDNLYNINIHIADTNTVPNSNGQVVFGVRYRIKNVSHGTVLDDWGGKTGENLAALMPDDSPDSLNRTWTLIPNTHGFRIKSGNNVVLDDWGGKTGEDSAALMPDDSPDFLNRTWTLIPNAHGFKIKSANNVVLDDWGGKTGEDSAALMPDYSPDNLNQVWSFIKI